jgi:hypothetical protein
MKNSLGWITRLNKAVTSWWGMLLICLILTGLLLFTYIFPFNGIIHDRDYVLQLWDLWVVNEQIIHWQNPFFTQLQYYPIGAHLGRHVLSPGFFPVTFLVYLLAGADPFYPLYTYKIVIWLSYALILYFSYLTLKEIGLIPITAFIPAMAYTFSDFYMNHLTRIHIISGFFIPATIFCLVRLYKKTSTSTAVICAALLAGALYFTEFALFTYMGLTCFMVIMYLLPEQRQSVNERFRGLGLKGFLISAIVFLFVASIFTYNWIISDAEPPNSGEAYKYSANLAAFFIPTQTSTPLYGSLFSSINQKMASAADYGLGILGNEVFIGFPLLLFGLIALFTVKHRLVRVAGVVSIIFFGLSLGPTLNIYTFDTEIRLPYSLLATIPPLDVNRNPVRFMAIGAFLWMIVAAFGLHWFYHWLTNRYSRQISLVVMGLIFLWTIAEVYAPIQPEQPYIIPPQLKQVVEGPVLNLPLKYHDGWALLPQIFHKQPIATGYVSRNSRKQAEHFETLRVYYAEAIESHSCKHFEEMGFRNVLISDGVPDDVVKGLAQLPDCSLNVVDLRSQ